MRVGVDARPLTVPTFGIGRYTEELLTRMVCSNEDHEWFFYVDRPLRGDWPVNVKIREFSSHQRFLSLLRTQLTFAHWAELDELQVFWSPRHHLSLFMKTPQVLTVHDMVWRKCPETMLFANLMVERFLMPPSVKRASVVVTDSEASKRDILDELGTSEDKITVVYPGATLGDLPPAESEFEDDYFLFLGTNEPRKNLPGLVSAHRRYISEGGKYRLVIAGGVGWGSGFVPHKEVDVLGYVDESRLAGLFYHSKASVLPSFYEGFGLPLLEAIQRGTPVIAGNVSAMPEVVGEAGILVDPLDISALTVALHQMSDESKRQVYADQCKEQAAKFSWDNAATSILQILERVAR